MKTIFSGIINFIIVIIVTLAIFATFLFLNTNEKGIVTIGDGSIISINDETMKGTLDKGDLIVVFKQSIENIVENDVVTYLYEENDQTKILTSRVYLVNQDENQINLVLKGDAQSEEDIVTINATNIIGKWNNNQKMVFVGTLYDFILQPLGFIIVITIPLVMLLGYVVIKLAKKQNKNKNKNVDEENIPVESIETIKNEETNKSEEEVLEENKNENITSEELIENDEKDTDILYKGSNESMNNLNANEEIEKTEELNTSADDDLEVL